MEIERKFLIEQLPTDIDAYPYHLIEQAYLCTEPVIRIRREDDNYYMTYKGSGMMTREEYNLPLNQTAYNQLKPKAEGNIIAKKRVLIPYLTYTIELDIFDAPFAPLLLAEVEFESEEEALAFTPPDWFGQDVTSDGKYHNSNMSRLIL
ncbi:MAG TPA: CYTH domain-containing protein [Lachnospiraceae bacterium]|jgi:adenylate cyclase|nr:CYTH domain-containing protein [Lachnospiraceae bacterium]